MSALIGQARKDLKSDEYDLRTWVRNRATEAKGHVRPASKTIRAKESSAERDSLIEMNLVTPEEQAWWKRNKTQMLRESREAGISEPHAIAELVRERVELEPERAVEFMQADADAWLRSELKREGYSF